jgi:hypothetical protein
LWAVIFGSIFFYQFTLGGGIFESSSPMRMLQFPMPMALVQLAVAATIRWLVIPRVSDLRRLLVLMIVGLALSEAVEFYGIFLGGRQMEMPLFVLCLLSVFQFVPTYATPKADSQFHSEE